MDLQALLEGVVVEGDPEGDADRVTIARICMPRGREGSASHAVEAIRSVLEREERLARLLERAGSRAGLAEFHDLLEEVLRASRGAPPRDPEGGFSEAELAALREGGIEIESGPESSLRTAARYASMLAGALSVKEAARHLGVAESRVRQRLLGRTLLGIKARRAWRLPQFQFSGEGTVPGLEAVLPALPEDLHPVALWRWFHEPVPELALGSGPVSPLDWLRSGGDPGRVAALAAHL